MTNEKTDSKTKAEMYKVKTQMIKLKIANAKHFVN